MSGRGSMTRRSATAARAARRLHAAYAELASARRAFAVGTRPADGSCFDDPEHAAVRKALHRHRPALEAHAGVVGFAVGRSPKPCAHDEIGIVVAVAAAKPGDELARRGEAALPETVRFAAREIPIYVLEVGRFTPHAAAGTQTDVDREEGTIGIFGVDGPTGGAVMITAMHLTGMRAFPAGSTAAPRAMHPGGVVGALLEGTTDGIDAAKFAVADPNLPNNFVPGIGQVSQWRPVINPGDKHAAVRMRGVVSGLVSGTIVQPCFDHHPSGLRGAILVHIPSRPGDSGAPLVDVDRNLLGFHVAGNGTGLALFSTAADTFSRLRCNL